MKKVSKPYYSTSPGQYHLGDYRNRQVVQNPSVSAKDINRVYGELEYYLKRPGIRMADTDKATLREIARNPQATSEMLATLLPMFPEEVKNNPVWDLLFWEDPHWLRRFVPDMVASPRLFEDYLNALVKHKILRFTGYSYYIPVNVYSSSATPWSARTSSREEIELKLTNMGYVYIAPSR